MAAGSAIRELSPPAPSQGRWHADDLRAVLEVLGADDNGLTEAEASARLASTGPNRLPRRPPPTVLQLLGRQFRSPLIYLLGAAALVSLLIAHPLDAIFISIILVINAAIGGYQEWRAEQSTRALQQLLQTRAAVLREGEVREINAEAVVPGDIVWLESGNRVPADIRLLSAQGLEVDESLLTGESLGVIKDAAWRGETSTTVSDRRNMAHAGSMVIHGRATGVVVATGTQTVVGQLALDVLGAPAGKPPLLERMERFARAVVITIVVGVAVVALLGMVMHGYTLGQMVTFAVALAVSAVPEGLPAALTVALAIATHRMARRGVIVRRLAAVEGLGSCTLIASDKTGTLTCNELTVRAIRLAHGEAFAVTGEGFAPHGQVLCDGKPIEPGSHEALHRLARAAVLCNEADLHLRDGGWVWRGDPTDVALLALAHKLGWARETTLALHPQVNSIPFEPERQYAATYHRLDGGVRVFVKGAPERVLAMCDGPASPPHPQPLSPQGRGEKHRSPLSPGGRGVGGEGETAESMASQGYRVLALAEGPAPDDLDPSQVPPRPAGLMFLGFVGMLDPLRPGAREAVAACRAAGITICMVTGDHPATALAIARDLGLATRPDEVVPGRELEGKSAGELEESIRRARVFARVAPRQKLELVEAARRAGHYVAVTGDGVNDAPALRAANIGVAMGKGGTDVAREAAELVISDDNFATIVAGVEEGRVAYDNVRKVIYLLISTGVAEVLLVGLAVATGLPLPLLPVQLLWLNLVTNGIQDVALAFEPSEGGVLDRKPRPPHESVFDRLMIERTVVGAAVMGLLGWCAFVWMLQAGWGETSARNGLLLLLVLFESIHIGNCRSETKSALVLSPLRSPILLTGAVTALAVHVAAMHLPWTQGLLRIEPVDLLTWVGLLGLALTVFVALEIHKWTWAVRQSRAGAR
ncbi:MAG: HAD-IC family P-type ATPase [Gemmataceae bacterium]|nr:HAD-IC family P-type ATPase [Gemmataceae bacterium]